jgi:Peptidase propeptide and YPEB domain
MKKILIAASALTIAASLAYAAALTEQQVVEAAIKVEETDIIAEGEGYRADDVECKDGQYDMTLDKDFKITGKEKED